MAEEGVVRAVFVDASSGSDIAAADLPGDQLPDAFDPGTTVAPG